MKIFDLLKLCVANLWKRKIRTLLTVLGVVIGTTSIVVMISLGVGLEKSQNDAIASYMDLTTINVYGWGSESNEYKLNKAMVEYINSIDHVVAASAMDSQYISNNTYDMFRIVSGRYGFSGSIKIMDLTMLEALGYNLVEGRFPTPADEYPVLFGEQAAHYFANLEVTNHSTGPTYDEFGNLKEAKVKPFTSRIYLNANCTKTDPATGDPLTCGLEPRSYRLNVVGVLKTDYNKDYDTSNAIWITFDFYNKLLDEYNKINEIKSNNDKTYNTVSVKVDDMKNISEVQEKIKEFGFETWSADEMRKQNEAMMRNIQMVLGALGAVSMLVAAIGIANTMVMSIYERTREIGIMKVIGCKLNDIRMMFLAEAACIGLLGGFVGIALSFLLSSIINKAVGGGGMMGMGGGGNISVIPIWLVLLGFGFSVGVGIISGAYPAYRAVRISALAAIRQD